jgi:hypothetical protein
MVMMQGRRQTARCIICYLRPDGWTWTSESAKALPLGLASSSAGSGRRRTGGDVRVAGKQWRDRRISWLALRPGQAASPGRSRESQSLVQRHASARSMLATGVCRRIRPNAQGSGSGLRAGLASESTASTASSFLRCWRLRPVDWHLASSISDNRNNQMLHKALLVDTTLMATMARGVATRLQGVTVAFDGVAETWRLPRGPRANLPEALCCERKAVVYLV